jgi:hypothetical protein
MNEPNHVIQEAFAVLAFSQPGFDFLYRFMLGRLSACLVCIAAR